MFKRIWNAIFGVKDQPVAVRDTGINAAADRGDLVVGGKVGAELNVVASGTNGKSSIAIPAANSAFGRTAATTTAPIRPKPDNGTRRRRDDRVVNSSSSVNDTSLTDAIILAAVLNDNSYNSGYTPADGSNNWSGGGGESGGGGASSSWSDPSPSCSPSSSDSYSSSSSYSSSDSYSSSSSYDSGSSSSSYDSSSSSCDSSSW